MRRAIVALMLAVAALLGGGAAAAAAAPMGLLPCQDVQVPEPARPSDGLASMLDAGPDKIKTGDPFKEGSNVTIYEVYGYGPDLNDYDAGCLSSGFATGMANLSGAFTQLLIAGVTALTRFIFDPNFMAILAPVFEFATQAFGFKFFVPLIGLAAAITGLFIIVKAKGKPADSANSAGGVVVVTIIAALAILYPLTIGAAVDKAISKTIAVAADTMNTSSGERDVADAVASTLTDALVYQPWVSSNFGRGNAEAAEKYAAPLYRTATLSRAEEAKVAADPEAGGKLIEQKKKDAEELVAKIKEEYPASYPYLAGKMGKARIGYADLAAFAAFSALFFLGYSLYRVLFAMVFVRVAVALAPLVAIAAQHPRWRWMMLTLLNSAGWIVMSSTAFAVVALILVGAAQATLLSVESGVNPIAAAVLLCILNVAVWVGTKKLRQGGPLGMATDALRGRKTKVPELIPDEVLPDPHTVPNSRPTSAPAESTLTKSVLTGAATAAGMAAFTAATGGAGAPAAAAAAAKTGAMAGAKQLGANAIRPNRQLPPAGPRTGVVMHTPAALATDAAAPAQAAASTVIQGEVVRPESTTTPLREMRAKGREEWEPAVHTPEARASVPEAQTSAPRELVPVKAATGGPRLYQIGK